MTIFSSGRRSPAHRPFPAGIAADGPPRGDQPSPATGPGWYESSWELRRGLLVDEIPPRDLQAAGGRLAPPSDT